MAEYGSEGFRGGKSVMKNSTVYNRGSYRAAPDIYETDPETGNLRATSGAPKAAGTTPTETAKPAFANVYADTPRPQGGNLAGSLATTAASKAAERIGGNLYNNWKSTSELSSALGDPDALDASLVSDNAGRAVAGAADAASGFSSFAAPTYGAYAPSVGSFSDIAGEGAGAASSVFDSGGSFAEGASEFAGSAAGDAAGAAGGGVPFIGAGIQLAQGNVGGAVGSVIGNLIAPGIGGVIGGLIGGGGRVICTELHAQGLLDADLYALDVAYTPGLHPAVVRGYHWWAIPYVRLMRRNVLATRIARPLAIWRAKAIAHEVGKGPFCWRGAIVRAIGEPLCFAIGLFVPASDWTQLYAGASK